MVWANATGDIGWWAAAKLPRRPAGVNPSFILDGSNGEAEKDGYYPFSANPQEENPARGYILSANYQPVSPTGMEVPGYYNLADRAERLDMQLRNPERLWDTAAAQCIVEAPGPTMPFTKSPKSVLTSTNYKRLCPFFGQSLLLIFTFSSETRRNYAGML